MPTPRATAPMHDKTLTESLRILRLMKLGHHVDQDLFYAFIREKVYLKYATLFWIWSESTKWTNEDSRICRLMHNVTESVTLCQLSTRLLQQQSRLSAATCPTCNK